MKLDIFPKLNSDPYMPFKAKFYLPTFLKESARAQMRHFSTS